MISFHLFKLKELDDLKENITKKLSIKEEMHKSEGRLMIRHILLLLGIGGLLIAMTALIKCPIAERVDWLVMKLEPNLGFDYYWHFTHERQKHF